MIEVKNLSASFGKKIIFENVNFSLKENSFTALCGKNGSGKSTLLSLMDGIIPDGLSYSGEILLDGKNVFLLKRKEIARNISYLVQKENLVWNLSVKEFLETGFYAFDEMSGAEINSTVEKTLLDFNMTGFENRKMWSLSGGEIQKCRLCRAFLQNQKILLLDEPSENLDQPFSKWMMRFVKNSTKTSLVSIHDINMASLFADEFLLFDGPNLIAGNRDQIFTESVLSRAYESGVKIYSHPLYGVSQVSWNV